MQKVENHRLTSVVPNLIGGRFLEPLWAELLWRCPREQIRNASFCLEEDFADLKEIMP